MKSFPLQIIIILLVIFLFSCEKQTVPTLTYRDVKQCDSLEAQGIVNDYNYPIKPGSPQWGNFTDEQKEMVLLIPADTLQVMCTHSLIETCFNYPLLWQIANYNLFADWWTKIMVSFNGIPELLQRPETNEKMLNHYLNFNEYPFSATANELEKYTIATRLTFMELFLAHENVVSSFSDEQLIQLGDKAKLLWEIKNEQLPQDDAITPTYSCYLLGRIMYYNGYGSFIIKCNTNQDLENFVKIGSYNQFYNNAFETILESYASFPDYLLGN